MLLLKIGQNSLTTLLHSADDLYCLDSTVKCQVKSNRWFLKSFWLPLVHNWTSCLNKLKHWRFFNRIWLTMKMLFWIWRACFQNLHPPPTCYSFALLSSFCNWNSSSLIKYVPFVGHFHLTYCTILAKWLGMGDMQEWTEEVLEPNKT